MTRNPYPEFGFPPARPERPYTLIDMVATIDGKIVAGERGEDVSDLGSAVDHAVLRSLEDRVDGVLVGAGTLRATAHGWNPRTRFRIVVSRSGRIDPAHSFFAGGAGLVAAPAGAFRAEAGLEPLGSNEPAEIGALLRQRGCERLLILGGSQINGLFLAADLVDEIFLTVTPRIKLGTGLPTLAEGPAFPRERLAKFNLIEHHAVGDELFLRYRRPAKR